MIITKSKYDDFLTCSRLLYLKENHKEQEEISEFEMQLALEGINVGEIGRGYFGDFKVVESNDKVKETKDLIDRGVKYIAEAAFSYKILYCAVDFMFRRKSQK